MEYVPSSKGENANILAKLETLDTHTIWILGTTFPLLEEDIISFKGRSDSDWPIKKAFDIMFFLTNSC